MCELFKFFKVNASSLNNCRLYFWLVFHNIWPMLMCIWRLLFVFVEKLHSGHFCWPSLLWVILWRFKISSWWVENLQSVHINDFSLLWVEMCFWRLLAWFIENNTVCTGVSSPHYGWACALSEQKLDKMTFHILHICALSPQCGWS